MKRLCLAIWISIAYLICYEGAASALNSCPFVAQPPDTLFPPRFTVDVWLLNAPFIDGLGFYRNTVMNATGLSLANVDAATRRAIDIWNEEGGSSIRIRYRGLTTTPTIAITDALVLWGETTVCDGGTANTNAPGGGSASNHRFTTGSIQFRQKNTTVSPPTCANIPWNTNVNSSAGYDYVAFLIHELGHGVYNLNHPNSPGCDFVSQDASVMSSVVENSRGRTLKQWELQLAQREYGPRSQTSQFRRNQLVGSAWSAFYTVPGQAGSFPLYRSGSLPSNMNSRYMGFTANPATVPQPGGSGFLEATRYSAGSLVTGMTGFGGIGSGVGLSRPVAVAGHVVGSNEPILLAYQRYTSPQPILYDAANAVGEICYRRSSNGVSGLGAEVCPTFCNGFGCFPVTTVYFGLTAAYDPYSNSYIIGYIANDSMQMAFLVVPSETNTTTPTARTVVSGASYHAPSVACDGSATGCKVVYESGSNQGTVSWLNVGVSPATGVVTVASSYTTGLLAFDTPGVTYWASDGSFRVAYASDNDAIYTYKIVANSITGTGDAFNDATQFVSSPVPQARVFGSGATKLYTWFLKYW